MFDKLMGNRWFWLGTLVFLATLSIWFRGSLFGFDSYATLSAVRFGWFDTLTLQPVSNFIWNLIPDSIIVFNLIIFASIFASIIPIFLLVKKFYDENAAWISIFLLLSFSPIILFEFGKFENELFAFPFIVWGIYFLLNKNYFRSFFCFCGSLVFWVWLYYFSFFNFGFNRFAIEMNMFSGLLNFWLLIPFIFFIPLLDDKRVRNFGLLFLFFCLWNFKLFIFVLPFIVLAIPKTLDLISKRINVNIYVYILALFCLIGINYAFLMQSPTINDWFLVDKTISLSNDANFPIYNDWSYGYWFWSKGIKVKNTGGTGDDINILLQKRPFIALTNLELVDCNLIYEKNEIAKQKTKIWRCD